MDDAAVEHRKECKENHRKISELWLAWKGNGTPGIKTMLSDLKEVVEGKVESAAMKKINEHEKYHEKVLKEAEKLSGRRWELIIGVILILISQGVTISAILIIG